MKQIFTVYLCLFITCGVVLAQEEWMPDPNLRRAVREALDLSDGIPLTQPVMNQLRGLEAVENQIMDLTGLEHATDVVWLNLGVNKIRDLSPLAGLSRLKGLMLLKHTNAFDFEVRSRLGEQAVTSASDGVYRCLFRLPICVFCKFGFML